MTTTATWFHCSAKPISRGQGRSSVAAAAYRLGLCLHDERYDLVHDYRRRGGVVTGFTLAPEGAPAWAIDPAQLWNAVETKENRKNSQLALEWEVALPNELNDPQREAIARRFSQWLVDTYGVAVSTGIHRDGQRGDGPNDHMHVEMTTRPIGEAGWAKNKLRQFNVRPGQPNPEIDRVREQAATFINDMLADAGSDQRVTHLSYKARGIARDPTTHLGPAASEMERREPGSSDRGDCNRETEQHNRYREELLAEQAAIDAEIAALEEQRLDDLYGTTEPDGEALNERFEQAPSSPVEAAVQGAIDGLAAPSEPGEMLSSSPEAGTPLSRRIDAAIGAAVAAIARFAEPVGIPPPPSDDVAAPEDAERRVEVAINPAIAAVSATGETSPGSRRRWKKMIDLYWRGVDRIADRATDLGREVKSSWRHYVKRRADRDYPGPER